MILDAEIQIYVREERDGIDFDFEQGTLSIANCDQEVVKRRTSKDHDGGIRCSLTPPFPTRIFGVAAVSLTHIQLHKYHKNPT